MTARIRYSRVNEEAHWAIEGRIDEQFSCGATPSEGRRVVINLAAVTSISSIGVRLLEESLSALKPKPVVLIHIAPAIAVQVILLPSLRALAKIESARLPFCCASCGFEKNHSVAWRYDAHQRFPPTCRCGKTMQLDGLPEHYLPSREDSSGTFRFEG
jgi:hypothetical protein